MHYLNSSYTTYTNIKRKRSVHLFQGRYKAIVVDKDSYLLELSRYLHLNPVRANMAQKPEEYPYSSYKSFVNSNTENMVSEGAILGMLAKNTKQARERYRAFVESTLGEELESPLKKVYGGTILGSEIFIREVLSRLESGQLAKAEVSHRKALHATMDAEQLIEALCGHYGITREEIIKDKRSEARKACIYLLKKHTSASNGEIGEKFGKLTYSAVAKIRQSFAKRMEEDKDLRERVTRIMENMTILKG